MTLEEYVAIELIKNRISGFITDESQLEESGVKKIAFKSSYAGVVVDVTIELGPTASTYANFNLHRYKDGQYRIQCNTFNSFYTYIIYPYIIQNIQRISH